MQTLTIKTKDLKKIRRILKNRIIGQSMPFSLANFAAPSLNRVIIKHSDPDYVSDHYRAFIDQLGKSLTDKTLNFGARMNNSDRFTMDSYHKVNLPESILFINQNKKINKQVLVITNNKNFLVFIPDKILVITPAFIHGEVYGKFQAALLKKYALTEYLHADHNLVEKKWKGNREIYSQWRAELRLKAESGFEILMTCKSMDVLQSVFNRFRSYQDRQVGASSTI